MVLPPCWLNVGNSAIRQFPGNTLTSEIWVNSHIGNEISMLHLSADEDQGKVADDPFTLLPNISVERQK